MAKASPAKYADLKLSQVTKELKKTYRQAQNELKEKLADFNAKFAEKSREKKKQLAAGEITEKEYKDWLTGQVFIRSQFEQNLRQVNAVMLDHNRQAMNLINNGTIDTFAEAYNFEAFKCESAMIASFNVYNAQAVARLMLEEPDLLPKWKIDEEKDYVWNASRVNNIIRQGIIQGEGVSEITDRLCEWLATSNYKKMLMFARTALGSAQEAGRQKQMDDLADMGVKVEKRWLATLDGVTRDTHRALDNVTIPYNEHFDNGLMFPKDPSGAAREIFNCRCTMRTFLPDYEDANEGKWRENEIIDGQTYEEWKKGKVKKGEVQPSGDPILEQFRRAAETAENKVAFWMNLDENQQAAFMASGLNLEEVYNKLGGGKSISEWKEANPGGADSFAIAHDYTNDTIKYNKISPKGDGWMADANGAGIINIRSDGLGDDWDFIIAHELGHQLANYSPELQQTILYNPGNALGRYNMRLMAFDGVYGEYNPEEAFATSVSVYIRMPDKLKERYPETYNAIDTLFAASPSAREFVDNAIAAYRKEFSK